MSDNTYLLTSSLDHTTRPNQITFQIVAFWPTAKNEGYLWIRNPSVAACQLLDRVSMWGGSTKRLQAFQLLPDEERQQIKADPEEYISAWEFSNEGRLAVLTIAKAFASSRDQDLIKEF